MTQIHVTPSCVCAPAANPRVECARCYRPDQCPCRPVEDAQPETRPRNIPLERELTLLAAKAAGHTKRDARGILIGDDFGLRDYADARSLPGGVRVGIDWDEEAGAEFGDGANYLVWGIIEVYDAAMAGDPIAAGKYERRMRALSRLIGVWRELLTEAS